MIHDMLFSEAYYGKNPLLEDCDKRFDRIKSMVNSAPHSKSIGLALTSPEVEKELRGVEENLKKLFNFKEVVIDFEGAGAVNAYTMPDTYSIDSILEDVTKRNKRRMSPNGIQFEDGNKKFIYISIFGELFTMADLTGAEVTGVILHEIGHNFFFDDSYLSLFYRTSIATVIWMEIFMRLFKPSDPQDKFGAIESAIHFFPGMHKIRVMASKLIKQSPVLSKISMTMTNVNSVLSNMLGLIFGLIGKILSIVFLPGLVAGNFIHGVVSAIVGVINPFKAIGYKNEKFADNFASAYGYGKELISTEEKFSKNPMVSADKLTKKAPILNYFEDMVIVSHKIFGYLGGVHPASITRARDQIKYLESQLHTVKNPRLKAQLQKDLTECKKEIEGIESRVTEANAQDAKIFSAMYFSVLASMGGDFRENLPGYKTTDYNYKQLEPNTKK